MPALVTRHFLGHLFHQRLFVIRLTGLECAPTHFSSPAKDLVLVLVQLIVELDRLVFLFICFLNLNSVNYLS